MNEESGGTTLPVVFEISVQQYREALFLGMMLVSELRPGMISSQDVFATENATTPLIKAGAVLSDALIERMKELNIGFIYVKEASAKRAPELLNLPRVQRNAPILSKQVKEDAITSLTEAFSAFTIESGDIHESSKAIVGKIDNVIESLVTSLSEYSAAAVNINDLKSFDDYTFHHSLSVAVISIAIAQELGFNTQQIRQLGMAAIMHDIGKTSVPIQIINKTSRLDDTEFSIIKTHSPAGFDFLTESGLCNDEVLRGVLHHHEKFDGSGYPNGLAGKAIPIYSRIIAIADVYDALTSNRPYRTPMQPAQAVEYIMGGAGVAFDFDLVSAFLRKIELYPIGTLVRLSTGEVGMVLENENQLRPVVQTTTGRLLDLERDRRYLNIVVVEALSDNYFNEKL